MLNSAEHYWIPFLKVDLVRCGTDDKLGLVFAGDAIESKRSLSEK